MKITTAVSLEYKKLFSDFGSTSIEILLKPIPTKQALELICHFYAQMHTKEQDFQLQKNYLVGWINKIPSTEKAKIIKPIMASINSINSTQSAQKSPFNFFNNYSTLILIQELLENHNNLPADKPLTSAEVFQLLKAYLYCSQTWIDKQPFGKTSNDQVENLIELIFPVQFPQIELVDFKDFRLQMIKASYFFKFCEGNTLFKEYLQVFLTGRGISTWRDYLKYIADIYVGKLNKKVTPSLMSIDDTEANKELITWLDLLCIDLKNFKSDEDFLGLREKPIYKFGKDQYLFLNFNFIIDKFYQGIKFDFAHELIEKKSLYKTKPIKEVGQFLGIYGEHFSESGLFYEVLNHVFANSKYSAKFSGNDLKPFFPKGGEPDYYMREKGKVYLFEYKDVTFASQHKHSFDYANIKSALFEKFVRDKKGKAEGVSQLVNSIEKIAAGQYKQFDNYDMEKMTIYPILVFTDMSFNTPGVNYLLNKEMCRQIEEKGLQQIINIKKLVMIDLDHLIKFQDHFRSKKITFNHCLNGYCAEVSKSALLSKVSSFTHWIHDKTYNMPYMKDPMLNGIIEDITR